MNLRQFRQELRRHTRAGNSVLAVSSSGVGKSTVEHDEFSKIKARDAVRGIRWGLGMMFMAKVNPGDMNGLYFKGERTYALPDGTMRTVTISDPSLPPWMVSVPHGDDPGGMPADSYDKFFLILEEYGQGDPDCKKVAAEILLNGCSAPHYLPVGSIVVASSNAGARYGVTKSFDFEIVRRTQLNIVGDARVWLEDFADLPYKHRGTEWKVSPWLKAWVHRNPTLLFEPEPKEQGPFCNPRTACSYDRYIQVAAEDNGGEIPTDDPLIIESGQGTLGMATASSMVSFMRFRTEIPSYESIVADPDGVQMPDRADTMMLAAYELAGLAQTEDLPQILRFLGRMKAKDMEMAFMTSLLRRDYKTLVNVPVLQTWIGKNAALVAVCGSAGA